MGLGQGFPNLNTAHFSCLLYQSHSIQLSSLVATPRPEMGVSDKGDVQCLGTPGLGGERNCNLMRP